MRIVVESLRARGITGIMHLDDGLFAATSFVACMLLRDEIMNLFERLGFRANEKTECLPALRLVFLGMLAHTAAKMPTWHVPAEKMDRYKAGAMDLRTERGRWTRTKLLKLAGHVRPHYTSKVVATSSTRLQASCNVRHLALDVPQGCIQTTCRVSTETLDFVRR